jgi:hypothetical protein
MSNLTLSPVCWFCRNCQIPFEPSETQIKEIQVRNSTRRNRTRRGINTIWSNEGDRDKSYPTNSRRLCRITKAGVKDNGLSYNRKTMIYRDMRIRNKKCPKCGNRSLVISTERHNTWREVHKGILQLSLDVSWSKQDIKIKWTNLSKCYSLQKE